MNDADEELELLYWLRNTKAGDSVPRDWMWRILRLLQILDERTAARGEEEDRTP